MKLTIAGRPVHYLSNTHALYIIRSQDRGYATYSQERVVKLPDGITRQEANVKYAHVMLRLRSLKSVSEAKTSEVLNTLSAEYPELEFMGRFRRAMRQK